MAEVIVGGYGLKRAKQRSVKHLQEWEFEGQTATSNPGVSSGIISLPSGFRKNTKMYGLLPAVRIKFLPPLLINEATQMWDGSM